MSRRNLLTPWPGGKRGEPRHIGPKSKELEVFPTRLLFRPSLSCSHISLASSNDVFSFEAGSGDTTQLASRMGAPRMLPARRRHRPSFIRFLLRRLEFGSKKCNPGSVNAIQESLLNEEENREQLTKPASNPLRMARFRNPGDVVYPLEPTMATNSTRADPSTTFDGVAPVPPSLPPDVHLEASRSTKGDLRETANKLVSCHRHYANASAGLGAQGRRFKEAHPIRVQEVLGSPGHLFPD
jgi:hypothetical protein